VSRLGGQTGGLRAEDEARLLAIAHDSVAHGLRHRIALALDPAREPPALRAFGASFVTLRSRAGRLRGCVGSLERERPLAADVAANAFRAAFQDPRFAPLRPDELATLALTLSILGEPERIAASSAEELAARLRRGTDGLILRQGGRGATFLPEVWDSIPEPGAFVRALAEKAGISSWNAPVEAFRYATFTIGPRR
jgi:AmmeMemoRadiSam system protein A